MVNLSPCTCGEAHPHEVARRWTVDGISVHLESDGKLLGWGGRSLSGIPIRRPRTPESHRAALAAGWMFMRWISVYAFPEASRLYADCVEAVRRGTDLHGLKALREADKQAPTPRAARPTDQPPLAWFVVSADSRGKPTERHARLPRLRWPGLAVIDHCGGAGSSRGRYELIERFTPPIGDTSNRETWRSTGFSFPNLSALWDHLRTI